MHACHEKWSGKHFQILIILFSLQNINVCMKVVEHDLILHQLSEMVETWKYVFYE